MLMSPAFPPLEHVEDSSTSRFLLLTGPLSQGVV